MGQHIPQNKQTNKQTGRQINRQKNQTTRQARKPGRPAGRQANATYPGRMLDEVDASLTIHGSDHVAMTFHALCDCLLHQIIQQLFHSQTAGKWLNPVVVSSIDSRYSV